MTVCLQLSYGHTYTCEWVCTIIFTIIVVVCVAFKSSRLQLQLVMERLELEQFLTGDVSRALRWEEYEIPITDLTNWGEAPIGVGTYSEVLRAQLGCTVVAVKVLKKKRTGLNSVQKKQFQRECGILLRLRHPHVIIMMGAVTVGSPCIIAELCMGGSVQSRRPELSKSSAVLIALQVALAIEYTHNCGFVHRDIKAGNVFLVSRNIDEPFSKLGDFGFGRFCEDGAITPGTQPGTLGRLAPEVLTRREYGPQSDIYAYGIFCFEIFTNGVPYSTEEVAKGWHAVCKRVGRPHSPVQTRSQAVQALEHLAVNGYGPDRSKVEKAVRGSGAVLKEIWLPDSSARPTAAEVCGLMRALLAGVVEQI